MHEVCINRLDISGSEADIKTFLNDFNSDKGFTMSKIVPYNYNFSNAWRHEHWGTINDIFEVSSYKETMASYKEENGKGIVSINYRTIEVPNEVFCKKASKVYPMLTFTLTYYEPTELFAGSTTFERGLEITQKTIFYEKDDVNKDNSLIDIYEFAIEEDFTSARELVNPIKKVSPQVRKYFIQREQRKIQDEVVLDFEDLKREYLAEGDESDD